MAVNFADLTRSLVLTAIIGTNKTKKYNYAGLSETGTADQVKVAGEAIVNSQAFADILAPIKAVLCTSEKELMYEA